MTFFDSVKLRLDELLSSIPGAEKFLAAVRGAATVWELPGLMETHFRIENAMLDGTVSEFTVLEGRVYIGSGSVINPFCVIKGPAYIGKNCRLGPNAYLRNGVIIGDNCNIGHASEIKNSIILDGSNAPHRNHVGDSVIGAGCNLGDGTKLANFKLTGKDISGRFPDGSRSEVHRRKLGVILEDGCQIGCNVVLGPGEYLRARTGRYVDRAAYVTLDLTNGNRT